MGAAGEGPGADVDPDGREDRGRGLVARKILVSCGCLTRLGDQQVASTHSHTCHWSKR